MTSGLETCGHILVSELHKFVTYLLTRTLTDLLIARGLTRGSLNCEQCGLDVLFIHQSFRVNKVTPTYSPKDCRGQWWFQFPRLTAHRSLTQQETALLSDRPQLPDHLHSITMAGTSLYCLVNKHTYIHTKHLWSAKNCETNLTCCRGWLDVKGRLKRQDFSWRLKADTLSIEQMCTRRVPGRWCGNRKDPREKVTCDAGWST